MYSCTGCFRASSRARMRGTPNSRCSAPVMTHRRPHSAAAAASSAGPIRHSFDALTRLGLRHEAREARPQLGAAQQRHHSHRSLEPPPLKKRPAIAFKVGRVEGANPTSCSTSSCSAVWQRLASATSCGVAHHRAHHRASPRSPPCAPTRSTYQQRGASAQHPMQLFQLLVQELPRGDLVHRTLT